ncbi:MAG: hypothetical protein ACREDZ_05200 [Kiloniellales bacterium]
MKPEEERERTLADRDALIADLLQRVEDLEMRIREAGAGAAAPPTLAFATERPGFEGRLSFATVMTPLGLLPQVAVKAGEEVAQAPGQIEVDEEDVERALERTLVQTGALLLPPGAFEIEPSFAYTRRESDAPLLVALNGTIVAGEQEIARNEFDINVDLRAGLPFDSQLEFAVPYRIVNQDTAASVNFSPMVGADDTGMGFGDVSVGLAKIFTRESGWRPDVIGRVTWDTNTAQQFDSGVALSGGFHEIRGSLTALKRQDPLAFVGGVFYEAAFESGDIDPGDSIGFSLGAVLAASPETSLRAVFDQSFVDEVEIGGARVEGSNQVMGAFTIGAASIVGHGILLDVAGTIGMTEDAPDYAVAVSVPIRF